MAIIYTPNYLYPTPSASGNNTYYTSYTPLCNKRQTFTSTHSITKILKKASNIFSCLNRHFYENILCTPIICYSSNNDTSKSRQNTTLCQKEQSVAYFKLYTLQLVSLSTDLFSSNLH